MAELLDQAFAQAAKLPKPRRDALAAWILAELADEERWEASFATSQDALARMADEARAEHRAGRTRPLNPETL